MHLFDMGRPKLPPLLKCVACAHRPGETYHHHIPLCRSCAATLNKHIKRDGGAILAAFDELRSTVEPHAVAELSDKIIHHATQLLSYEEKRLKTIDPEPTVIIHRIRVGEYMDLFPTLEPSS